MGGKQSVDSKKKNLVAVKSSNPGFYVEVILNILFLKEHIKLTNIKCCYFRVLHVAEYRTIQKKFCWYVFFFTH